MKEGLGCEVIAKTEDAPNPGSPGSAVMPEERLDKFSRTNGVRTVAQAEDPQIHEEGNWKGWNSKD